MDAAGAVLFVSVADAVGVQPLAAVAVTEKVPAGETVMEFVVAPLLQR